MFAVVALQFGFTLIAILLAGVFVGERGAISAAVGGLAYAVPSFLFAFRLAITARRSNRPNPFGFFIGEFTKVAATIGLLSIAIKSYPDLHWPSMLIALAVALQAVVLQPLLQKYCFAIWKKS